MLRSTCAHCCTFSDFQCLNPLKIQFESQVKGALILKTLRYFKLLQSSAHSIRQRAISMIPSASALCQHWLLITYLIFIITMNHSISTMSGKTKLKIILLGNQNVGKTCIIDKYINDRFEETANPTVGIDFLAKNLTHNARVYRLQLWDTAGQERFRAIIPGYLKDAHCALIIFDVAAKATFADVESWIKLYTDHRAGEGFIFLVGNKVDRQYRQVTQEEGLEKANRLGLPYFEISAKTGQHIEDLFISIVEQQTDKSITSSKFLTDKRDMKPVEAVKEEKEEKEEEEVSKVQVEQTGAKIEAAESIAATGENIVLKSQGKPEKKNKKQTCC